MRRREFIELAAVCAALAAPGLNAATKGVRAIDVVLFDERYPDAQRFSRELVAHGAVALATCGEVVTLWRESDLASPGCAGLRIASLTQHSDFELIRSFVRHAGLRVLQEGRHTRTAAGVAEHSFRCGPAEVAAACTNEDWPVRLAAVMSHRDNAQASASRQPSQVAIASYARPGTLTSALFG